MSTIMVFKLDNGRTVERLASDFVNIDRLPGFKRACDITVGDCVSIDEPDGHITTHVVRLSTREEKTKLTTPMLLALCAMCSKMAKGEEAKIEDFAKSTVDGLVKRKLAHLTKTRGRIMPTDEGFLCVGNLAPVPLHILAIENRVKTLRGDM